MKKIIVNITFYTAVLLNFSTTVFANSVKLDQSVIDTLTEVTRILLLIGGAICIGKVIHIGIMYVTSSAADKSNAKMAIMPWLIGTFVCFGAATIGGFIIDVIGGNYRNKPVLEY